MPEKTNIWEAPTPLFLPKQAVKRGVEGLLFPFFMGGNGYPVQGQSEQTEDANVGENIGEYSAF